jgi:hypothetical protein
LVVSAWTVPADQPMAHVERTISTGLKPTMS